MRKIIVLYYYFCFLHKKLYLYSMCVENIFLFIIKNSLIGFYPIILFLEKNKLFFLRL